MILEKGNMWNVFGKTELFLITTNPIIRKDGAVVMGRGIAKEVKERFPRFPYLMAEQLSRAHPEIDADMHCCSPLATFDEQLMGYFMVKRHWREPALKEIIANSVEHLLLLPLRYGFNSSARIDLNFPGIGYGKLKREDVLPLLEELPDNVHVWEYG